MRRYYLDYNATTPLDDRVRAAMEPYLSGLTGNASSVHAEGRRARAAIDCSRDQFAASFGVKPSEIIFTAGGTESCNLAVQGLAHANAARGKHLVVSAGDHHSVLHAAQALEKRYGFEVTYLPLEPEGFVDPDTLLCCLRPDTILVSVLSANNETGVKSPMSEIGAICAQRGILFHTDAVQSAGKEKIDLKKWQVSALSLTGHKFGGPVGAGLLYLKAGIPLARLMEGGAHENERRPGTENVAAIVGLAKAFELANADCEARNAAQFALTEKLWEQLSLIGNVRRNGDPVQRLGNTLSVSFLGLHGEEFLIGLDLAGLAVSSGSACLVGSVQASHVLKAMGIPTNEISATVRFSIGNDLTESDILDIAQRVSTVVKMQAS
jgi:cysteine desulfurase